MEKIDRDFEEDDYLEFDDVLDRSFFTDPDDMPDLDEDESNYDSPSHFRPISEL